MNCYFCKNKIEVDWKDVDLLKKFISAGMKIKHRKYTKFCAKHQEDMLKQLKELA
jgi:small subunit ribosomal protein S18